MNIRALVIAGGILVGSSLTANAQFTLTRSVLGSGGVRVSNAQFSMQGTVGQAVIGPTQNSVFTAYQGFWYTAPKSDVKPEFAGDATGYGLEQNYPNPFNPSTTIQFSVPERTKVTLRVMNLLGEEVVRVLDQETYDAGKWTVDFQAKDLPSGTYVYRLEAGNFVASKKMVLMK